MKKQIVLIILISLAISMVMADSGFIVLSSRYTSDAELNIFTFGPPLSITSHIVRFEEEPVCLANCNYIDRRSLYSNLIMNSRTLLVCKTSIKSLWNDYRSGEIYLQDFVELGDSLEPFDIDYFSRDRSREDDESDIMDSDIYLTSRNNGRIYRINSLPSPGSPPDTTFHALPNIYNAPQAVFVDDLFLYVTTAEINPVDSTYNNGKIWRLEHSGDIDEVLEIGINPINIETISRDDNKLFVLCKGDGETSFGTVYVVCKECMNVIDSIYLGGQPKKLSYNSTYRCVYSCTSSDDSHTGKLLAFNAETFEVIFDISSRGNDLGDGYYDNLVSFNEDIFIPYKSMGYIQHKKFNPFFDDEITSYDSRSIGYRPFDIVYHYDFEAIEENPPSPQTHEIIDAYPNPFNSSCRIDAPEKSTITIYNIQGQSITRLKGNTWSPRTNVPSGIYTARVEHNGNITEKKVVYIQ